MKKSSTFFYNLPYESYEKKSSYEVENSFFHVSQTYNTMIKSFHFLTRLAFQADRLGQARLGRSAVKKLFIVVGESRVGKNYTW